MKAYLFSGQGSQFVGMGKIFYKKSSLARKIFHLSNDILNFDFISIMFNGSENILKKTINSQLAIYIYSFIETKLYKNFLPDMVAGLSLGEFSALTAINVISFEDGLILVKKRGNLMQKACESIPGKMVAIFGLKDEIIEHVCKEEVGIVVPSNYNSDNQLVISGDCNSIKKVCLILKKLGASRILELPVYGAFHSPIMGLVKKNFIKVINKISFNNPICPIYQNFIGTPVTNPNEIKNNLIEQLISPVKWKHSIKNMIMNGANHFTEIGPSNILKNMAKKMLKTFNKKM
ncbi:ACP S-malonyltransferase [Blattabacterium cuenoti]|uniref:ACP S-malonyltransferase n=1 Tax=Blattabacterium cuenoti TaxID=1653831 RepID=UPI00163C134A|nr:ACP S-malonyltransferase [Blattabacterium cuenoti]